MYLFYLHDSLEGLVTFLVGARLLQVSTDAHVLAEEDLAVVGQPVKNLVQQRKMCVLTRKLRPFSVPVGGILLEVSSKFY